MSDPITAKKLEHLLSQGIMDAHLKVGDTFIVPKSVYDIILSFGISTIIDGVKVDYPKWDELAETIEP